MPKEKNSKNLEQFRPISLLNVEGKIFFGVIAKRMMRFVLNKKFVNTSIQKLEFLVFQAASNMHPCCGTE